MTAADFTKHRRDSFNMTLRSAAKCSSVKNNSLMNHLLNKRFINSVKPITHFNLTKIKDDEIKTT